jgi:hypothetical protein
MIALEGWIIKQCLTELFPQADSFDYSSPATPRNSDTAMDFATNSQLAFTHTDTLIYYRLQRKATATPSYLTKIDERFISNTPPILRQQQINYMLLRRNIRAELPRFIFI